MSKTMKRKSNLKNRKYKNKMIVFSSNTSKDWKAELANIINNYKHLKPMVKKLIIRNINTFFKLFLLKNSTITEFTEWLSLYRNGIYTKHNSNAICRHSEGSILGSGNPKLFCINGKKSKSTIKDTYYFRGFRKIKKNSDFTIEIKLLPGATNDKR